MVVPSGAKIIGPPISLNIFFVITQLPGPQPGQAPRIGGQPKSGSKIAIAFLSLFFNLMPMFCWSLVNLQFCASQCPANWLCYEIYIQHIFTFLSFDIVYWTRSSWVLGAEYQIIVEYLLQLQISMYIGEKYVCEYVHGRKKEGRQEIILGNYLNQMYICVWISESLFVL